MTQTVHEGHFEDKAATLECHGGSHHVLIVDGEKMFRHEWHHSPTHVKDDWYRVTKGVGWTTSYVKINEDVARHATFLEHLYFRGVLLGTSRFRMSPNKSAQIK